MIPILLGLSLALIVEAVIIYHGGLMDMDGVSDVKDMNRQRSYHKSGQKSIRPRHLPYRNYGHFRKIPLNLLEQRDGHG